MTMNRPLCTCCVNKCDDQEKDVETILMLETAEEMATTMDQASASNEDAAEEDDTNHSERQPSAAASGSTTLEAPASYRTESPTFMQRAFAPIRQVATGGMRRRRQSAQDRSITPETSVHTTPPTTPEQQQPTMYMPPPRTPERDPLLRQDPIPSEIRAQEQRVNFFTT